MRILVDLDGTICALRADEQSYADVEPLPGAAEKLRALRSRGHYVIIATARSMQTCAGNLGQVMKTVGLVTLDWLARHGIEYDEIHFGKPNADVYLDDRAVRFHGWSGVTEEMLGKAASTSETLERP